jgi:hypothetical protein
MKTYLYKNAFAGVIPNTLYQRRIIFLFILLSYSILAFSNTNNAGSNEQTFNSAALESGVSVDTNHQQPVEFNLPLVLLSFTVSMEGSKQVKVEWVTGSEKDLAHFVIERSNDGKNYVEAGMVNAAGTSVVKKNYTFTETIGANFPRGVVYYRLRMIDIVNRYQNSVIRNIQVEDKVVSEMKMVAYPNPVVNEVKISIPSSWRKKQVSYDVYSLNGTLLKHISAKPYNQTEVVGMQEFGTGIYVVKASTDTDSAMQRIVKK